MNKSTFVIPLAIFLVGCDNQTQRQTFSEAQQRIQTLETEIIDLKSNQMASQKFDWDQWRYNTNFDERLNTLETSDFVGRRRWAFLDPTTKSYQRIDTDVGSLLVSVKSVQPYLDGYKVTLAIGNPYAMDFNGFGVSCKWSLPYLYTNGVASNAEAVKNSEKSKDLQQTEVLRGGWWTPVELTISPATADELKMLRISVIPNNITLLSKPDSQP